MTNVFSSKFQTKSYVYWKGFGVFGEDTCLMLPLHSIESLILRRRSKQFSIFGIIFTHILLTKGGESSNKGLYFTQSIRFWRFMPKGEKVLAQSKRTAHHTLFLRSFSNWYLIIFSRGRKYSIEGESSTFKKNSILKPSWTLRGGIYWGGVLFSQRKSIWNRGRKFQILKMLLKILLIYLWLFAKGLWKEFTKEFAKTKLVVQAWSKM
jgi:hypothetical protein